MTDNDDTLIIVTSDHAHTMSISGYPDRGNAITGLNGLLSDVGTVNCITRYIINHLNEM